MSSRFIAWLKAVFTLVLSVVTFATYILSKHALNENMGFGFFDLRTDWDLEYSRDGLVAIVEYLSTSCGKLLDVFLWVGVFLLFIFVMDLILLFYSRRSGEK